MAGCGGIIGLKGLDGKGEGVSCRQQSAAPPASGGVYINKLALRNWLRDRKPIDPEPLDMKLDCFPDQIEDLVPELSDGSATG